MSATIRRGRGGACRTELSASRGSFRLAAAAAVAAVLLAAAALALFGLPAHPAGSARAGTGTGRASSLTAARFTSLRSAVARGHDFSPHWSQTGWIGFGETVSPQSSSTSLGRERPVDRRDNDWCDDEMSKRHASTRDIDRQMIRSNSARLFLK